MGHCLMTGAHAGCTELGGRAIVVSRHAGNSIKYRQAWNGFTY